jgi:transmembrane sensor
VAFEDVDLETALREFNRYGRTPIVLGDPLLAQLRVSGVFRIGEVDAFLQALNTAFDIAARRRAGAIELHLRG